jgi:hypothetical protein
MKKSEARISEAHLSNHDARRGQTKRVTDVKEYIGEMSDEEMAADRWENEGGRTPLSHLRLPASLCELNERWHLCRDKQAAKIQLCQLWLKGELSLRFPPLMSSLGSSLGGKLQREEAGPYSTL